LYTEVILWSQTQEYINILEFVTLSFSTYKSRLLIMKIYEQMFLNFLIMRSWISVMLSSSKIVDLPNLCWSVS